MVPPKVLRAGNDGKSTGLAQQAGSFTYPIPLLSDSNRKKIMVELVVLSVSSLKDSLHIICNRQKLETTTMLIKSKKWMNKM